MLYLHIVSGFICLITGAVSSISKKGSKVHKNSGLIFFLGMIAIGISSILLAFPKGNWFLFTIGIFSFYNAFTGFRANRLNQVKSILLDKLMVLMMFITVILMMIIGGNQIISHHQYFYIVILIFAFMGLKIVYEDYKRFFMHQAKHSLLRIHIVRMSGAFIACITAFIVVNAPKLHLLDNLLFLEILLWILPSIMGSFFIAKSIKKYTK